VLAIIPSSIATMPNRTQVDLTALTQRCLLYQWRAPLIAMGQSLDTDSSLGKYSAELIGAWQMGLSPALNDHSFF
jgi:hypothetical protein